MTDPPRRSWGLYGLLLLVLSVEFGCAAAYTRLISSTLRRLEYRDYEGALAKLEKKSEETDRLLYRLEKGLILHYAGGWSASNGQFERAERLIDKRYTRSASREIAALLTNDAIRPYRGEEFERTLIHYYRAMNYYKLGLNTDALVECRKANLRLADFAAKAEYELSYNNDAFLQYLTGAFYEAEGEWNDAYISYRDAIKGFAAYRISLGMEFPEAAAADLQRSAVRLGFDEEWDQLADRFDLPSANPPAERASVIVIAESGFIGRKVKREISVPILEDDDIRHVWMVSDRLVHRYHYGYHSGEVDYWLRIALPEYRPRPRRVHGVQLRARGRKSRGWMVEDLDAIAQRSFAEKENAVLTRTAVRALAKYVATELAEEKSDILGFLVNLFGAGTEAADTRSWQSLPATIWMARMQIPPGTTDVVLEFLDAGGFVVAEHLFPAVEVSATRPLFLSHRSFR
ncbi:MAG: hypothetical protein VX733_03055 [Candidatus Latescibacterota bacterium]|nr:hypothetical protein [Candidatus Latescibacterota bacterium]